MTLAIVTATTDVERAKACIRSWLPDQGSVTLIVVVNGRADFEPVGARRYDFDAHWIVSHAYLGTVPAFRVGVDYALSETPADIIAALHDDLEILEPEWIAKTIRLFERHPMCGLAGFGGAVGLGASNIYQVPYDPMQLARIGFRSNLVDAEVHGVRSLLTEQVACLDGFSQIGRREFFLGIDSSGTGIERPWQYFEEHGIIHHAYDSLMGAYASRLGWETWYLPIRCRHYGGQTAVGDRGYQAWAAQQIPGGDHGYWQQSHQRGYDLFRDQLPIRL